MKSDVAERQLKSRRALYHNGAGGEIRTHVLLRDGILSPAHEVPSKLMRSWFDLALLPLHRLHLFGRF